MTLPLVWNDLCITSSIHSSCNFCWIDLNREGLAASFSVSFRTTSFWAIPGLLLFHPLPMLQRPAGLLEGRPQPAVWRPKHIGPGGKTPLDFLGKTVNIYSLNIYPRSLFSISQSFLFSALATLCCRFWISRWTSGWSSGNIKIRLQGFEKNI